MNTIVNPLFEVNNNWRMENDFTSNEKDDQNDVWKCSRNVNDLSGRGDPCWTRIGWNVFLLTTS